MLVGVLAALGAGFVAGRTQQSAGTKGVVQLPPLELSRLTQYWLKHDDSTGAVLSLPLTRFNRMSSPFGWRRDPFSGQLSRHDGLDFSAGYGTPILAASCGVVKRSAYHPSYGYHIDIEHGLGLITRYAHARNLLVKAGQLVNQGQIIAHVGSTGASTGPHLHFEVIRNNRPLDPRGFLSVKILAHPLDGSSVF